MAKFINITGQVFGRLIVWGRLNNNSQGKAIWICRCVCGNFIRSSTSDLRSDNTKSCGCLIKEKMEYGLRRTHGLSKTPEYRTWKHINGRCYTVSDNKFYAYGARGITVCDRWRHSFENFLTDMGSRPSKKHSIERINNNGNYEPGNCTWALPIEQANNKRNVVKYSFNGQIKSLPVLAKDYQHKKYATIYNRIKSLGWSIEKALLTPS